MKKKFVLLSMVFICVVSSTFAGIELNPGLTVEEAQKDYSKYWLQGTSDIDESVLSKLDEPLSLDKAIYPEEVEKVLDLDSEFPTGYALLDNGYTYSAVETVYSGVTPEMFMSYLEWRYSLDDQVLSYKIWCPEAHVEESYIANVKWICEDIGMGLSHIIGVGGDSLEAKGINPALAEDSRIIMSNGMNSINVLAEGTLNDRPYGSNVLHVFYENEEGEFVDRCVIYLGCIYDNGEVLDAQNGNIFTEEDARNVTLHIATENANAASLTRQLYEEGVIKD